MPAKQPIPFDEEWWFYKGICRIDEKPSNCSAKFLWQSNIALQAAASPHLQLTGSSIACETRACCCLRSDLRILL
jgi:hypothetical protein